MHDYTERFDEFKRRYTIFTKLSDHKQKALERILANVKECKTKSLLDVGAGDGALSIPLSTKFGKVVAIDKNPVLTEALRRNGISAITSRWEDVQLEKSFDVVLASHFLYYIEPRLRKRAVQKMYESLSPGGKLILIVNKEDDDFHGLLFKVAAGLPKPNAIAIMREKEAMEVIRSSVNEEAIIEQIDGRLLVPMELLHGLCELFLNVEASEYEKIKPSVEKEAKAFMRKEGMLDFTISDLMFTITKPAQIDR